MQLTHSNNLSIHNGTQGVSQSPRAWIKGFRDPVKIRPQLQIGTLVDVFTSACFNRDSYFDLNRSLNVFPATVTDVARKDSPEYGRFNGYNLYHLNISNVQALATRLVAWDTLTESDQPTYSLFMGYHLCGVERLSIVNEFQPASPPVSVPELVQGHSKYRSPILVKYLTPTQFPADVIEIEGAYSAQKYIEGALNNCTALPVKDTIPGTSSGHRSVLVAECRSVDSPENGRKIILSWRGRIFDLFSITNLPQLPNLPELESLPPSLPKLPPVPAQAPCSPPAPPMTTQSPSFPLVLLAPSAPKQQSPPPALPFLEGLPPARSISGEAPQMPDFPSKSDNGIVDILGAFCAFGITAILAVIAYCANCLRPDTAQSVSVNGQQNSGSQEVELG